jgi:hypothetical protein
VQTAGHPDREFTPVLIHLIEFHASDGTAVSGARGPADTRVVRRGSHLLFLTAVSASR